MNSISYETEMKEYIYLSKTIFSSSMGQPKYGEQKSPK